MQLVTLPERFERTEFDAVLLGGETWLRGPQIGAALGFENPMKAIQKIWSRNEREFDDTTTLLMQVPTAGGRQLVRLYNARGAALIAMKAQTPKGEAFRRWVLDVLEGKTDAEGQPVAAGEMTPGVLYSLRAMFTQRRGNTALLRYREKGLSVSEIAKLLDVRPASINPRLRVAEFLGLLTPPADLEKYRSKESFMRLLEGQQRARQAYRERQAAKALPAPDAREGAEVNHG